MNKSIAGGSADERSVEFLESRCDDLPGEGGPRLVSSCTAHLGGERQVRGDSPETFGQELKKITVDAPVYASHRKIPFERDIESQIRNLRDRRARVLLEKNYTL